MTNENIVRALDALMEIKNKELPVILAYKVIDNYERLLERYRPYTMSLDKLKERYGDDPEKFDEEAGKLFKLEVDVSFVPITREELTENGITLTPAQLMGLKPLITEGENG